MQTVLRVMDKVWARYQYLTSTRRNKQTAHLSPAPVKILVMGGSVTRGVNCHSKIKKVDHFACAWPRRLELLLNQAFGISADSDDKLVEVRVVGIGGTNTATGTLLLDYDLLPTAAQNADIVINNYSTNDMQVITQQQAQAQNTTLQAHVFDMAQTFVRTALRLANIACSNNSDTPLLLWLDDYVGNEQPEILSTMALKQSLHVLADYYGVMYVSYADLVRRWVDSDTREFLFSPPGWYSEQGSYSREIHPGAGAHQTMA